MTRANRHYARFIPREEVGDVRQWDFGDVHGADALRPLVEQADVPEPEPLPAMDHAEHQALVQQAHDEGHARGLAEGREQARLEWQQRMDEYVAGQGREAAGRLARLAQAMEDSLAGMQQAMAREVREALALLVGEGRAATVRLNPADWAALQQPLREEFGAGGIQWLADAAVEPGDCLVESAGMVVDGTLDKRWRRAIAALGLTGGWREETDAD